MLQSLKQAISSGKQEFDLAEYQIPDNGYKAIANSLWHVNVKIAVPGTIEDGRGPVYLVGDEAKDAQALDTLKREGHFILYVNKEQANKIHPALEKAKEEYTAWYGNAQLFSFCSALYAAFAIASEGPEEFFDASRYVPTTFGIQAVGGLLVGTAYGIGIGPSFSYKRAFAGIVSTELALAGTYMASHFIENPTTRIVISVAFLAACALISSKLLSADCLRDTPELGA